MTSLVSTAVPLRYARENVLFGPGEEVSSLFRVPGVTYDLLPGRDKGAHMMRLARFTVLAQADFSISRVMRRYPAEEYVAQATGLADASADLDGWHAYLANHERHLDTLDTYDPEVYFNVAQRGVRPRRLTGQLERMGDRAIRAINEAFGVGDPAPIPGKEIDQLLEGRQHALGRIQSAGFPGARSISTRELQWLARRAACRHVAEPLMDPWWRPNALVLPDGNSVAYQPRGEFERLFDAELRREDDHVVLLSQRADGQVIKTYQAFLVIGALPDDPWFPGPEAELMYAPLEQLGFPVDIFLHANWLPNKQAIAEARKALRAHKINLEEAETGGVALDDRQLDLQVLGRDVIADLMSSEHPPSVEASLTLAIGAGTLPELRRRINATREIYTGVVMHHPTAIQEQLYYECLPRTGGRVVHRYREMMNARVLGGLMPTATRHVGSHRGIYHAYTVAAGMPASPVKIDVTAASRDNLPTSWFFGGRMGSGKTSGAQIVALGAAMRSSDVITVDPKPDHNICALPMLKGRTRVVSLEADERYRGELDPLTWSPRGLREGIAVSYLLEVLPESTAKGDWETEIAGAVKDVAATDGGLLKVLDVLRAGNAAAVEAARRLTSFSQSGLGILAFGDGARSRGELAQVTTFRMPGIELPDAALERSAYERDDLLAVATFKLFTAKIMGLATRDRKKHKVVIFDEAWALLGTQRGRAMLNKLIRYGRTFDITVILCSQTIVELGALEDLIGMRVVFGVETTAEAQRGLKMVGADPDDDALVAMLTDKDVFRAGRALLRDLSGNVADVQFDAVDPVILAYLDTSPNAAHALAV